MNSSLPSSLPNISSSSMAKTKKNNKAAKARAKPKVPRPMPVMAARLDGPAQDWANLLVDPCSAPLVHPIYPGANGGVLMRFEGTYNIGFGATETAGVFQWTPGNLGSYSSGTLASNMAITTATSGSTTAVLSAPASSLAPGYTFLTANAAATRCVGACIQIFYLGTELNRSGILSYGNLMGGAFNVGDNVTADGVSNTFEHFTRTPDSMVEIKWRPSAYDGTWTDPQENRVNDARGKYAALGFAFSGLQAAMGYRVRMVAVYEWTPSVYNGVTTASASRARSNSSMDDVINFLDRTGDWTVRMGRALGRAYQGASTVAPYVRAVAYTGKRIAALTM